MQHVIRLAAPVQTWAGYRATHSTTHTLPLPTVSGLAGLIGACIGESDHLALIGSFTAFVRVDRTNPVENDLQVAVPPPPGRPTHDWHRSVALHEITTAVRAGAKIKPYRVKEINLTGGTNKVQYSPDRTFLPHAEFVCVISATTTELDERLRTGFRRPTFMPYLGRMANAPSFPFFLGSSETDSPSLLAAVPHVARDEREARDPALQHPLRCYEVAGGYTAPRHRRLDDIRPPVVAHREQQLTWAAEELTR